MKYIREKLSLPKREHGFFSKLYISDLPYKIPLVVLYFIGAIYLGIYQDNIRSLSSSSAALSPAAQAILAHPLLIYLVIATIFLLYMMCKPIGIGAIKGKFRKIGLKNHMDEVPHLLYKHKNDNITIWCFLCNGISLQEWKKMQGKIETVLNINISTIIYGNSKQQILIYSTPAKDSLPSFIGWHHRYLQQDDFSLVLGKGYMGLVNVNLSKIPHILLGGSTGSGKSILLKCLLIQAIEKNAYVYIADFKGGVDFGDNWQKTCRLCFDNNTLLKMLNELVEELEHRKSLFRTYNCADIGKYNQIVEQPLKRYIFACDEVAELLDKTGLSKEQKEFISQIESKLSIIARQGRAFGIHLILATQRPDANILSGQIRNNMDCKICGRADQVLSQIILDSTAAADSIPKNAQGRFLMNDGTIFQGFYVFDDFI